jgi:hypothetical protein
MGTPDHGTQSASHDLSRDSTSTPTPHTRLARIQRFTCGVALLRHLRIGSPPHANVTLSPPIGPSNSTYTHTLQQNRRRVTRSQFLPPREHAGRECLDGLKQNHHLGAIIPPTPANCLRAFKTSLDDSIYLASCCGSIFTFHTAHDLNMPT